MKRTALAREMVEAAKMLMMAGSDGDVFTVLKPIRLKTDYGTANSLTNARLIADAGYKFIKATYAYDKNHADWKMTAFFERGSEVASHIFRGFSFGYGGEGPHGMVEFGKIFNIHLDSQKILSDSAGLPEEGVVDLVSAFG